MEEVEVLLENTLYTDCYDYKLQNKNQTINKKQYMTMEKTTPQ